MSKRIRLHRTPDGACDVVCCRCGASGRIHPVEPFIAQIRLFLDQHHHNLADMSLFRLP
jgi:hypothetical protein